MKYVNNYFKFLNESLNDKFNTWFDNSVISNNGKPIIMYHARKKPLIGDKFDANYHRNDKRFLHGTGVYFTSDEGYAFDNFGYPDGILYSCYLSLKKPFNVNLDENDLVMGDTTFFNNFGKLEDYVIIFGECEEIGYKIEDYIKQNFDHIYMRRVENGPDELIVFDPKKIKSINNNGTWDKNNDNIYQ